MSKTTSEKIISLHKKGVRNKDIAIELGITRGYVSGALCTAKKKGLIPNLDGRTGKTTPTKTTKNRRKPAKIKQIPLEYIQDDSGFVVIVGKGQTLLDHILNQVRL